MFVLLIADAKIGDTGHNSNLIYSFSSGSSIVSVITNFPIDEPSSLSIAGPDNLRECGSINFFAPLAFRASLCLK